MFDVKLHSLPVLVTIILAVQNCSCFPSGPPLRACDDLTPTRHIRAGAVPQDLGYEIRSPDYFYPGQEISMRIGGLAPYKGLILQVREEYHPTGRFKVPENFQTLQCPGIGLENTAAHANRIDKNLTTSVFQWEAPSECRDGETFSIRATVVQSFLTIQTDLRRELTCRHPPTTSTEETTATTVEVETTPAPPVCVNSMMNSIPDGKYSTSFEEEGELNGWVNEIGWRRNSGPTPTPDTGPDAAADGEYYMYYPAEGNRLRAVLSTERDLRGCFCVKLEHSHNVRDDSRHVFVVTAGKNQLYRTMSKQEDWRKLQFQVDSETFVRVRIVARKGRDIFGDTAIDSLDIVAGPCSDDDEESTNWGEEMEDGYEEEEEEEEG